MDLFDLALYRALNKGGGGDITVEPLTVNENGQYAAPTGKAYSPVGVNVQPTLQSKTVTENGTVTADSGYDGLSEVVVNVQGGGGGSVYTHSVHLASGSDWAYLLIVSTNATPFTLDTLKAWFSDNGITNSADKYLYPAFGTLSGSNTNIKGAYLNNNTNYITLVMAGMNSGNNWTVTDTVIPA